MKVKIIQYNSYGDETPVIKEEETTIKKVKLNMSDKQMQKLFNKLKRN